MSSVRQPGSSAASASPPAPRVSTAHVLIASEDASEVRELHQLLGAQHEVTTAAHALDVPALLRLRPADLLLVSEGLLGSEPGGFIRRLRDEVQLPALRVVLLAGDDAGEEPLSGGVRAVDDLLIRPFGRRELLFRIRTQLELGRLQRESAERVRESEARFRHVADHSPLMFWVTEPDGRCIYLNDRWYEFTGQRPEDALGFGWIEAIHPEDRPRIKADYLVATAAQNPVRFEYRLRRHDHTYRWMLDSGAPRFIERRFAGYVGSVVDITDEREEREKLGRERSQMEMALRAGRIGAFEWDIPAGKVIWSPELEALYGLAPGTFEGSFRSWTQRVVRSDAAAVEALVQRCFEERREEAEYEFRAVMPDGTPRWLEGKARFIFAPNGTPRRMIGINIDVDDRKRAEINATFLSQLGQEIALLSEPRAMLEIVCRSLGQHLEAHRCYFVTTNETATHAVVEIDWVRQSAERSLTGSYPIANFSSPELWREVTAHTLRVDDVARHPLARQAAANYASLRMASWASAPFMRDGRWVASLVVADERPRIWRDDEVRLIESVLARVWPLVERARSEQAVTAAENKIRESEERLRITMQAAGLGIWDVNPRTGEMIWDARCKELFGLPADAPITWERFLAAIHPDDRARVEEAAARALAPGSSGDYDIELRVRSAPHGVAQWVRASGKALFDAEGQPTRFLGTVLEITDLVKARETLAERRAELERLVAERTVKLQETVAELEGFSYSISHDLRAPLRAMQSFAQLLNEEYSGQVTGPGRDYLRRIINASERMDRLIHDVLVYSQVSRTELQLGPVDLEQLIDGIVESYPQFQPSAADITIQRPLPRVLGNEAALTQCISNLLGNAVKFVRANVRPRIEIRAEVHGARVRLCVRDNGIGIPPEAHEKIFAIFERLSRGYEGTGIGLAVVRKAAERMGGSISVQSAPGEGSTFCLELAYAL